MTSYLSYRKQYCTFLSVKSDLTTLNCGVPQGSILGPLLFLIYVNDLGPIFTKMQAVLFADDTNLVVTGNSLSQIERIAKDEIPILVQWLNTNRLSS